MQRKLSEIGQATLADQLLALAKLDASALKERWRALYQTAPPARISLSLLRQAVAYRVQEHALGGLKSSTRRLLERVTEDRGGRQQLSKAPATTVRAGSVLIREWHGVTHRVTVLAEGALFRGKRYRSLSEVARLITGTRWSGPRFFGLRAPTREHEHGRPNRIWPDRARNSTASGRLGHSNSDLHAAFAIALPAHVQRVGLNQLLQTSDIVSVLCPLNDESRGMLNAERLGLLKPGAIFVNTARGKIVDEAALYELALNKHIRRIAIDVFDIEPPPPDSLLWRLPNRDAILTPHLVAHTAEVIEALPATSIESVERILAGEPPLFVRNPEVLPLWKQRWGMARAST